MSARSGNMRWLMAGIVLGGFLIEVQPREIGHKIHDKREDWETPVRKSSPVKAMYDRYLADMAELRLTSRGWNHPPVIAVRTLHGGKNPEVKENIAPGQLVAFVEVTDPDDGQDGQFDCWIDNDKFELEKVYDGQYKLLTRARLDYETQAAHNTLITCADHGINKQIGSKDLRMAVVDVNDNPPIFTQSIYEGRLMENNKPGEYLLKVHAEDRDGGENGRVTYRLRGSAGDYLTINKDSGYIFAKAVFDYEKTPELTLGVMAVDHGWPPITSHSQVNIKIIDDNDY